LARQLILPSKDLLAAWLSGQAAGTCWVLCKAVAQADKTIAVIAANNRELGRMTPAAPCLMLCAEHLPATVGALLAGHNAIFHIADLIAFGCTGFANLRTKLVQAMQKMRAGQLKIGRSLADLGTVQHQAQMFGFDVLAAGFQAMVHRGLQTNLVA